MPILLPPSEGKAVRGDGPPLDLGGLSFPALTSAREKALDALVTLAEGPGDAALAVLGLSPGLAGALAANRALRTAPTLAAARLYTGVLYDNLGLQTLGAAARARADRSVIVFSGLWGALRLRDRVPPYRLSMGVTLPPLGGLAAHWRPCLAEVLGPEDGLVVDLRSSTYAQAWRPGSRAVTVRVLRQTADGSRSVVSHMAKATRGAVARSLLEAGAEPATPRDLADLLVSLGHAAELGPPPGKGRPWNVDVVIRA
ncbi:peroxide stress protein YaaA [Sphaerisporangium sp. TRM90804]|uniref:peroxide stress protein YaaA n=1 Tax=Sphaerisporangium sp. TRM90804 TaxID=3031113 RepID=UPI00244A7892|nr:peroxide stress protein YaaA [Sphaerisporangium sp. TRM90804]MDH2428248.1 peroxide stress protein YaaA [Sphaerisporangium sp. TRM90804]